MHTVALFGAGKIGETICALLTASGRYRVRVCDLDGARAATVASRFTGAEGHGLNLQDPEGTAKLLAGCAAVMSALPYHCNVAVAEAARAAKAHYLDLTEDVATTDAVARLAEGAPVGFMPQCGLAPGFISIAAAHLFRLFDSVDAIKMRVGALPVYPSNKLKYNLTWSTEGLINEYLNRCESVINGEKQLVEPLEGYETFSLDGSEYEAFNTSGGLGSLADTFAGKVRALDYKTIRYPGHRDLVHFLMHDLAFKDDREGLRRVFERSIPTTKQDKCIIFVEARGRKNGTLIQRSYVSTVYNAMIGKEHFGAIQITTASGICAPLDLLLSGKLAAAKGFLRCEDIPLPAFLENEFGRHYHDAQALSGIA